MAVKEPKRNYFVGGKPRHRKSYCAFLDVLGFSERVRASYTAGNSDNLLQKFQGVLAKAIEEIRKDVDADLLEYKSFTDNVVLCYPQATHGMEEEFASILFSMRAFQLEMSLSGFFVRGGLSLGSLFVDENSVYGQALLDAYYLENQIAVNPVIVLSDNVMQLVDHHMRYYEDGEAPQQRELVVGPDGRYFVSYLMECVIEVGGGEILDTKRLGDHKWQIERALQVYAEQPRAVEKFRWLAAYHNYFCDTVASGFDNFEPDLRVASEATKIEFRRLQRPETK